jgi:hypothetical protein
MYCQVYLYRILHTNFTSFTVKKGYPNYKTNTECLTELPDPMALHLPTVPNRHCYKCRWI